MATRPPVLLYAMDEVDEESQILQIPILVRADLDVQGPLGIVSHFLEHPAQFVGAAADQDVGLLGLVLVHQALDLRRILLGRRRGAEVHDLGAAQTHQVAVLAAFELGLDEQVQDRIHGHPGFHLDPGEEIAGGGAVGIIEMDLADHAFMGIVVPEDDLRQAGEAGLDPQGAIQVVRDRLGVLHGEVRTLRTGSDKAHIAAKDVHELGQFIDMQRAQPFADFRDARIQSLLGQLRSQAFRVHAHGAVLQDGEDLSAVIDLAVGKDESAGAACGDLVIRLGFEDLVGAGTAVDADPLLRIKDRTLGFQLD